jgi:broad specificity phosphatase PhoE
MEIFLIRHCQSIGNRDRKIQGWLDSPLTEEGREAARKLAGRLAGSGIGIIYSSTLRRALETARVLGEALDCPVREIELLREINVGCAEGLTVDEVEKTYPLELKDLLRKEKPEASFPGGETLGEFHRRSGEAWKFLTAPWQPQSIACVSHGWMLNALLKRALGLALSSRNLVFPNGSIQHIRSHDGLWELVSLEKMEAETPRMRVWQIF